MRYIKNFLYNLTDIVLAIVIVALASGIIYWRLNIILDYPKQLASEQAVYQQDEQEDSSDEDLEDEAEQTDEAAESAEEQPAG